MERYDVRLRGTGRRHRPIQDPPFARVLFGDVRFAWLWLVLRVYIGWQWVDAGRNKLDDGSWMHGGVAVKGFWERAVVVPDEGQPPIADDWYRELLQYMLNHEWYRWVGPLIAVSETLIGIALILGLFTGITALFGSILNVNFMLAGSAAANPVLFMLAIILMLAWKTAGWIGLDRWVLPLLGTPWSGDATSSPTSSVALRPLQPNGTPSQPTLRPIVGLDER